MIKLQKYFRLGTRFLATWRLLFTSPSYFMALSIAQRRRQYSTPMQFFWANYFLTNVIAGFGINLISRWLVLPPVISVKSLLMLPGVFDLALPFAALGLESLCWFWICHKLLGHRITDRHQPPYKRVFNELLYITWPAAVMCIALYVTSLILFSGFTLAMAWFTKFNLVDFDDIPEFIGTVILVIVVATSALLVLIPLLLPILVYNTLIGRVLFKLPRRRAIVLACIVWVVSGLPFIPYGFFTHYMLPTQLAGRESLAVEDLRSLLFVERYYYQTHHAFLEVNGLKHYIEEMIPDADSRKTLGVRFFPALERVSGGLADGYKFTIETASPLPILHATPMSYGGQTVKSMFCFAPGTGFSVFVEDRHGDRASLGGKRLISFEPDVL